MSHPPIEWLRILWSDRCVRPETLKAMTNIARGELISKKELNRKAGDGFCLAK